jgi:hypothetical protein
MYEYLLADGNAVVAHRLYQERCPDRKTFVNIRKYVGINSFYYLQMSNSLLKFVYVYVCVYFLDTIILGSFSNAVNLKAVMWFEDDVEDSGCYLF